MTDGNSAEGADEADEQIRQEVAEWAEETRIFFAACRRLVEYFGEEGELESWEAAATVPLQCVDAVVAAVPPRGRGTPADALPNLGCIVPFRCGEATARIISPLAEVVGVPISEFVYTVRRRIAKEAQSAYVKPYGWFVSAFADAVTHPLWHAYRHLAPEEWKEVFKEKSKPSEKPGKDDP